MSKSSGSAARDENSGKEGGRLRQKLQVVCDYVIEREISSTMLTRKQRRARSSAWSGHSGRIPPKERLHGEDRRMPGTESFAVTDPSKSYGPSSETKIFMRRCSQTILMTTGDPAGRSANRQERRKNPRERSHPAGSGIGNLPQGISSGSGRQANRRYRRRAPKVALRSTSCWWLPRRAIH